MDVMVVQSTTMNGCIFMLSSSPLKSSSKQETKRETLSLYTQRKVALTCHYVVISSQSIKIIGQWCLLFYDKDGY